MATNPTHTEIGGHWLRRGRAISEEEYHELERLSPNRKYEYIDGMAYLMSGGSVGHDLISFNMRTLLARALRGRACRAFGSDVQVHIGAKKNGVPQFYYPDVTVSCSASDHQIENTRVEAAHLVVEVLSPGTELTDRGRKFRHYQACASLQEIVLVNQFAPYIEVWQRDEHEPTLWQYRHYGPGESVELGSIGVRLDLAEIYEGIDFFEPDDD